MSFVYECRCGHSPKNENFSTNATGSPSRAARTAAKTPVQEPPTTHKSAMKATGVVLEGSLMASISRRSFLSVPYLSEMLKYDSYARMEEIHEIMERVTVLLS